MTEAHMATDMEMLDMAINRTAKDPSDNISDKCKNISLIIRPVAARCNLRCIYCYNENRLSRKRTIATTQMSIDVLDRITNRFVATDQFTKITMLWHGGEPFLAGTDLFINAVKLQKTALLERRTSVILQNSIQSNGTIFNEALINLLVQENFQIGISVDGPDYIHNRNRLYRNGKKSHSTILKNIRYMKKLSQNIGIVSVVTKLSIGHEKEIIDFFISENLTNIHFLPFAEYSMDGVTLKPDSISDKEFGYFLLKVFDIWRAYDNPKLRIRILNNFLQGIIGGETELCTFRNNCKHHLAIESDGNVYICGRNANVNEYLVGSVGAINTKAYNDKLSRISNSMQKLSSKCSSCTWLSICNGGCSYYRRRNGVDLFCDSYKMLLEKMHSWATQYTQNFQ